MRTLSSRDDFRRPQAQKLLRDLTMRRYAWLFDQRFEPLRASFEAIVAARHHGHVVPIDAYREFPDVSPTTEPDAPPELRQRTPEEINEAFSRRWRDGERWGHDGRDALPLASFTMEGVKDLAGIDRCGVTSHVVRRLSDKTVQYPLFRDAKLPVPNFTVVRAESLVKQNAYRLAGGALFLQPAHSAGGEHATLARCVADLHAFRERFGDDARVVAARFVPDCRTVSGNAIVARDGRVLPMGVTELLQHGFRFDGFIFPSFEPEETVDAIEAITTRVGELLRERGYWGWYTADMILREDGELLVTEANVRFSGEAAFIAATVAQNPFELMLGTARPSGDVKPDRAERIVVTKIRPQPGQIAAPIDGPDELSFLRGTTDAFRVGYHRTPIRVVDGHFVGLAGARMSPRRSRADALRFYASARVPHGRDALN